MTTLKTLANPDIDELILNTRSDIVSRPAQQQPTWDHGAALQEVLGILSSSDPLVSESEILALRAQLAGVADGASVILQAGDCAEPPNDTSAEIVSAKADALTTMAQVFGARSGRPVVRIGRIGGQFAKPRSQEYEVVGGTSLPTYRGGLVNDPFPSARARRHELARIPRAHAAAGTIMRHLRARTGPPVWASHEALVLDYELPQLRATTTGDVMLASAHTIWLGARTKVLLQSWGSRKPDVK